MLRFGKARKVEMKLIAVYIAFVLVGLLIAYGVGRLVEMWSEDVSLFVFLGLFFLTLWAGWRLALKLT
jgi:hypothetical protein